MMQNAKEIGKDSTDAEILRMVQETNDAQAKGILLVLLRISNNLSRNTDLTQTVHSDFENHRQMVTAYMEQGNRLLNRGIGAWKVVGTVAGVLYAVGVYVVSLHLGDLTKATRKNEEQDIRISTVESRLEDTKESLRDHLRQANPLMRELQRERGLDPNK
jgi:hypothetical protein